MYINSNNNSNSWGRGFLKGPPEYCQDGTVTHLNYNRLL